MKMGMFGHKWKHLFYCINSIQGNSESPLVEWCDRRRRSAFRIGLVRWDPTPPPGAQCGFRTLLESGALPTELSGVSREAYRDEWRNSCSASSLSIRRCRNRRGQSFTKVRRKTAQFSIDESTSLMHKSIQYNNTISVQRFELGETKTDFFKVSSNRDNGTRALTPHYLAMRSSYRRRNDALLVQFALLNRSRSQYKGTLYQVPVSLSPYRSSLRRLGDVKLHQTTNVSFIDLSYWRAKRSLR